MSTFLKFFTIALALTIITAVLWPATISCGPTSQEAQTLSRVKQVATGLIIYASDYDSVLPNVYTQSEFENVLMPYVKNAELFQPLADFSTAPTFNYNLSGVQSDGQNSLKVLGQNELVPPSEVPMVYSIITDKKEKSPIVISYADSSTKAWPSAKPFNPAIIFATQFQRGQITK